MTLADLRLKEKTYAPLFAARFRERVKIAEVVEKGPAYTMKEKWGDMLVEFNVFVRELKERLN